MDRSIIRISKEISDIQKGSDLSIAVACKDVDVRNVKALIMGPHETPYEYGFFEFLLKFGKEYPSKAPSVSGETTNGGRTRFNPNIYANGKVCLSILGTWRGEPGEEWSSAQGLESVLISIQSLMSTTPYENEPGFEDANSAPDKVLKKSYNQKIQHETIRLSVVERLERYLGIPCPAPLATAREEHEEDVDESNIPFEPFKDICKRRFLWYYESYLAAVRKGKSDVKDGTQFTKMPFEMGGNTMDGRFNWTDLERRLGQIKNAIDAETRLWASEGLAAAAAESTVAVNLKHQYDQVIAAFQRGDMPHNAFLENENPFVWIITYIGRPMTNLDGGLLRIKMNFSRLFPHEQPRATFETKIFHTHIAPDGTACYTPPFAKSEDVRSHIDAIFAFLEEDEPAYDPRRIVNPDASRLFWASDDKDGRKQYNRRLRRSVQQSMENFPE